MTRYYFHLTDEHYREYDAFIPDGNSKKKAVTISKKWMADNNITHAHLDVNSFVTGNLLDVIEIEL